MKLCCDVKEQVWGGVEVWGEHHSFPQIMCRKKKCVFVRNIFKRKEFPKQKKKKRKSEKDEKKKKERNFGQDKEKILRHYLDGVLWIWS